MLAVVDQQQHAALAEPVHNRFEQRLLGSYHDRQRGRDRAHDRSGVGDRGQIDEEHTLVEVGEMTVAEFDCCPCLANSTRARQREDAADSKHFGDRLQQRFATDERRRVARQVRAVPEGAARLREVVLQIGVVHLEERDGTDVAESMGAECSNLHAVGEHSHHFPDGFADHDLAAVCCRGDACCVVDRHADQVVVIVLDLTEVHAYANPQT